MRYSMVLWSLWAVLATPALGETYLVIPDSHLGDFPNIQAAIDGVVAGDVIELADGMFWGTGNWDIDWGGKEITIRSRSGNAEACVVDGAGPWGMEDHFGFHIHDVGQGAVLDRVTISHGDAGEGGGIRVVNASPTITGCVFLENTAGFGGGIMCDDRAFPLITGCVLRGNFGVYGGGIECDPGASPTISRCSFYGNHAATGGALCI